MFFIIDIAFLGANLTKIPEGGWYVLVIAGLIFVLMWSWRVGRALLMQRLSFRSTRQDVFLKEIESHPPYRVPGTAVVLTGDDQDCVPASLMHHISCTHVLHERVIFLKKKGKKKGVRSSN